MMSTKSTPRLNVKIINDFFDFVQTTKSPTWSFELSDMEPTSDNSMKMVKKASSSASNHLSTLVPCLNSF